METIEDKLAGPGGVLQHNWTHVNLTQNDTISINESLIVINNLTGGELPENMRFSYAHMFSIAVYSVLMVVSSVGNLTVLTQLFRRRRAGRASRLDVMLMHLAIADLMVSFLLMPLEIAWASTVQWMAGDMMCRLMMFTRTFGLYLSSFVLICISVDRYYAILKPLNVAWETQSRQVLAAAWVCAALASLPQSFIFHLGEHPEVAGYYQCVSYGSLTKTDELLYFIFNMLLMYVAPLTSTIICSTAAVLEIIRKSHAATDKMRRSGVGILGRARARTIKMTVTILLVFFACWTPYYFYCLWYWIDKDSATTVDPAVQKAMWFFSCTNSCANPIVYGLFYRNRWNWKSATGSQCCNGSTRRGSRLPYGDSTEISASTLAKARMNSLYYDHRRRNSSFSSTLNSKHMNNNHVDNDML